MASLNPEIFKAYDIRGLCPDELDETTALRVGEAIAAVLGPKMVAVGRDVRLSGPSLEEALIRGLTSSGVNVVRLGVITTDQLYYAVGSSGYDAGVTVSASHNPAEYNGFKMIKRGAAPMSSADLAAVRDWATGDAPAPSGSGEVTDRDVTESYLGHVLSFVDIARIKELRVVANANFGAVGPLADRLAARLGLSLERLNWERDGSFPKGPPNPLLPTNRTETTQAVKAASADLGVGWDADADRCFFFTGSGRFIPGCFITALLARRILESHPGEPIIYDLTHIWAVEDAVRGAGGVPVMDRVGHTFIKARMRAENAPFAGESSGHYYFRDNFSADNGLIPFLMVCELMGKSGGSLDELMEPYFSRYFVSDELNYPAADAAAVMQKLRERYADGDLSQLDGLSVEYETWRFNARPSNTEPLLRLNVESRTSEQELAKRIGELEEVIGAA